MDENSLEEEDQTDGENENTSSISSDELVTLSKLEKLTKKIYRPQFINLNVQFGDSEVFLVDGDALLLHCLNLNENVLLSSLHLIFLMEVFLYQFLKRSGRLSLIFFSDNQRKWTSYRGKYFSFSPVKGKVLDFIKFGEGLCECTGCLNSDQDVSNSFDR